MTDPSAVIQRREISLRHDSGVRGRAAFREKGAGGGEEAVGFPQDCQSYSVSAALERDRKISGLAPRELTQFSA